MRIYKNYRDLPTDNSPKRVVSIGNFDGIHTGHQMVLNWGRKTAVKENLEFAVFTFSPHPFVFFHPDKPLLRIVNEKRKQTLLKDMGIELLLMQHFNKQFASINAKDFAGDVLFNCLSAKIVIVGQNFKYGTNRKGNIDTLKKAGNSLGFKVHVEEIKKNKDDIISSSLIRQLLLSGDVVQAAKLLGRFHELTGKVQKGKKLGRKLGYPTCNLGDFKTLAPRNGVYCAYADIDDKTYKCAVNVGARPTFDLDYVVEAHILDFDNEIYGKEVTLRFVKRIRDSKKFASSKQLIDEMKNDVNKTRKILDTLKQINHER